MTKLLIRLTTILLFPIHLQSFRHFHSEEVPGTCKEIIDVTAEEQIIQNLQKDCSWLLVAPEKEKIAFKIVMPHSALKIVNFEIYDGSDNSSLKTEPTILKWLISSNNELFIETISTDDEVDWKILFTINKYPLCNKTVIITSDGVLSSLDEPNTKAIALVQQCIWYLKAPYKSKIKLKVTAAPFYGFMANTPVRSCRYYNFTIYKGLGNNRTNAIKTCYFGKHEVISIKRNTATISYVNSMGRAKEISVAYSLEFDNNKCTAKIISSEESSILKSPLYPHHYPKGLNCSWLIEASSQKRILLSLREYSAPGTYTRFNSYEFRMDCWTSLIIYDGSNQNSPILHRFCESFPIENVTMTSTQNKVLIVFVTSELHNSYPEDNAKFLLEYKAINKTCDHVVKVTEEGGYIISPSYNVDTVNNKKILNCSWLLNSPKNSRILIDITKMIIMKTPKCEKNYLRIFDITAKSSLLIGEYCDRSPVMNIEILSNKALIVYHIETLFEGQKFELHYKLEWSDKKPKHIDKNLYARNEIQYISNPHYPSAYLNNFRATWHVIAPKHRRIRLILLDGLLEFSENCIYDFLKIYDGNDTDAQLLGTFCSHIERTILVTSGSTALISFVTDYTITKQGFIIGISLLYDGNCYEMINIKQSGHIFSPYFPLSYPNSTNCTWILNAPAYHWITLITETVSIEYTDNCTSDYIAVECAFSENDIKTTQRICGNKNHKRIVFKCYQQAFIFFISDSVIQGPGMSILYAID